MKYTKAYDFYYTDREDYEEKRQKTDIYKKRYRTEKRKKYQKEYNKKWYEENREERLQHMEQYNAERWKDDLDGKRHYDKERTLKNKYGITVEIFDRMVAERDGKCDICKEDFDYSSKSTSPAIDHDHDLTKGDDGFIRGILCMYCNLALGNFRDDVERLKRAIKYLKRCRILVR